jgi:hypothetical protein
MFYYYSVLFWSVRHDPVDNAEYGIALWTCPILLRCEVLRGTDIRVIALVTSVLGSYLVIQSTAFVRQLPLRHLVKRVPEGIRMSITSTLQLI